SVTRPPDANTSTVRFLDLLLPEGPSKLAAEARAYPDASAAAPPVNAALASGLSIFDVHSGQDFSFTITMTSSIDRVELDPPSTLLLLGNNVATFTPMAKDKDGNIVMVLANK